MPVSTSRLAARSRIDVQVLAEEAGWELHSAHLHKISHQRSRSAI